MKYLITFFCALIFTAPAFSQGGNIVAVKIQNVAMGGGAVYLSVTFTKEIWEKRTSDRTVRLDPVAGTLTAQVELPAGECVISAYQDTNGNGKLDNNLLGVPREPVAISRWNGRGIPGGFNRHKVAIDDDTQTESIDLYKL